MIELLVLNAISKREQTMYGIRKHIEDNFSAYTNPSFGAIKPALRRLEQKKFIVSRKMMSDGGKLSIYYSITKEGLVEIKSKLLDELSKNPHQFLSDARIKLSLAGYLSKDECEKLFLHIKSLALTYKNNAENIINNEYNQLSFYQRIVLDNTICEYANFITIIEGFEKDNARNS